jgi:hypothetical protein
MVKMSVADPGTKIRDPGWVKIRIGDKHPGSVTLIKMHRIPDSDP